MVKQIFLLDSSSASRGYSSTVYVPDVTIGKFTPSISLRKGTFEALYSKGLRKKP